MRAGAAQGLRVWLAYGVVEYFVTTIVDGVYLPRYIFPSSHWSLTLLLFGIYAGIGLVVGTATGLAIHLASHKFSWLRNAGSGILLRSAVLFSLVVAFCANITYQLSTSGLTAFALAMSLTLTLAAALSVRSTVWDSRLGFITNPWTASFLLVGPLWMIKSPLRFEARQPKLVAAMVTVAVILLASIVIHRFREKARRVAKSSATPQSLAATLLRLAPLVLMVLVATPFVDQRFLTKSSQINSFSRVAESPNVIWIVLDTVRADHMSVYGYNRDTTPNLRKLSEQATVYLNAIAPSDFTLPSHASMLTGLYPSQHGAHYFPDSPSGRPLAEGFRTLPEILASKGYSTICVAANYPFLDRGYNLIQGFQHHEA
jgi:glucan phosphoethanolaminetransferase (alkaline phosphatase superfamily)